MLDNHFLLATIVAKRAKELMEGAKALVKTKCRKPVIIALEEIKAGKVFFKEKDRKEQYESDLFKM